MPWMRAASACADVGGVTVWTPTRGDRRMAEIGPRLDNADLLCRNVPMLALPPERGHATPVVVDNRIAVAVASGNEGMIRND